RSQVVQHTTTGEVRGAARLAAAKDAAFEGARVASERTPTINKFAPHSPWFDKLTMRGVGWQRRAPKEGGVGGAARPAARKGAAFEGTRLASERAPTINQRAPHSSWFDKLTMKGWAGGAARHKRSGLAVQHTTTGEVRGAARANTLILSLSKDTGSRLHLHP